MSALNASTRVLYGVGDAVGALLMPPGAISLLVDADVV
jgi:hypothetical protein